MKEFFFVIDQEEVPLIVQEAIFPKPRNILQRTIFQIVGFGSDCPANYFKDDNGKCRLAE